MIINSTQCVRWGIMMWIAAKRAFIHIMESFAFPPATITQTTVLRLIATLLTDAKIIVRLYLKIVLIPSLIQIISPNKWWMLNFIMSKIDQCLSRHACLTTWTVKHQISTKTFDEYPYSRKNAWKKIQNQDEWKFWKKKLRWVLHFLAHGDKLFEGKKRYIAVQFFLTGFLNIPNYYYT